MNVINDIISVLKGLSLVDYVLYISVLILIILCVALFYVIRSENLEDDIDSESLGRDAMKEKNEELDLQAIVNSIDENPKPKIDISSYEEEQEQTAIISYDELLKKANELHLNYEEEQMVDDVIPVKKIDISSMFSSATPQTLNEQKVFHYEREEAFLKTLKELNQLLN